jgi:hypothetical protein
VNCAGLTESLLESELLGYVSGSVTGAYRINPAHLQMALHGTLFLDQIGESCLRMQALLLRFLENGEIQAVGSGCARIEELARRCLALLGSMARVVSIRDRRRCDKSEVGLLLCDASKAAQRLNWTPRVSLDEGLRRAADHVRAHRDLYPAARYVI